MFTIIDRYVAKLFMGFFLGGVIVFVTLFLAIDFMSNGSRMEAAGDLIFQFYAYQIPAVIYQMVPFGCLIATVFTLSNLHKSNELIALYSAGMSLARVSAPILILVSMISAVSFWASDRLLPIFNQKKNYVKYVEIDKRPGLYSMVKTNKIWYRSENILFNIKTLNVDRNVAQGITLYYFDEFWRLAQLITSSEARMDGEKWQLAPGTLTVFSEASSFPVTQKFDEKTIFMGQDAAELSSVESSSDVLSMSSLAKFIKRNKEAGLDTLHYEVDYHSKFGFAFAAFVMSILGIPFSLGGGHRSGGAIKNVALCMGLAFLYWSFYNSLITMGKHGVVIPVLAAWVPNVTMVFLSVFLLFRLKR